MKFCVLLIVVVLLVPVIVESAEIHGGWNEAGIRVGIQAGSKNEFFHLYEAFAVYELPWEWRSSSGWGISTQVNTSLGALHTGAETGVIGSLGTGLTVSGTGISLVPELGISVDMMDKRHFGKQDFGRPLLFGAYLGLSYHFDCGVGIGYRLLHLSNGHIFYPANTPNPGVDLHMISTSWHF